MAKNFKKTKWNLRDLAQGKTINYDIEGYWVHDAIQLHVYRNFKGQWEYQVNTGSGGYEDTYDVVKRTRNFASAMHDAANTIEYLRSVEDELEKHYQKHSEFVIGQYAAQMEK